MYKLKKRFAHLSQTKIIFFIAISIILCVFILIFFHSPINQPKPPKWWPIHTRHTIDMRNKNPWVAFGGYAGLPFYWIKKGSLDSDMESNQEEIQHLVTVTTFCDINLLYEAEKIANNYKSGPLSISVYIDANFTQHIQQTHIDNTNHKLKALFNATFANITNKYDIIIGLLYINQSNEFYQSKGFLPSTPLVFRLPMNPLRNLAEYQVTTDWTFNIDVDFWYVSNTLNENVQLFINEMNDIVDVYGYESVFIVPSFEVLTKNKPVIYATLNKTQLMDIVQIEKEIIPFHWPNNPQMCTDYNAWYNINENYQLNHAKSKCSLYYEPWYIMNSNLSRKYKWDNQFIGRGYSKTSRVLRLRHHCFNFMVMKDLFIIHAAHEIHAKLNQTLRNKWTGKNRELLIKQVRTYYGKASSCLTQPLHIKIMHFVRNILFGFAQMGYDAVNNYNCNGKCKC